MDTRSICLEEVSVEEFQKLEDFWKDRRRLNPSSVHSRLRNPIIANDYPELLSMLIKMDYAHQICVRKDAHNWMKRLVRLGISDDELRQMADLAAKDKIKRNYFELKLREPSAIDFHCAIIDFTEYNGKIVSYKARIPYQQKHLFTINASRPFAFNNAVWVPE